VSVRAFVLIEADQTRVDELRDYLPELVLAGSRVVWAEVVTGPYDLIALVESTDLKQLGE
jgi:hypothetical protein